MYLRLSGSSTALLLLSSLPTSFSRSQPTDLPPLLHALSPFPNATFEQTTRLAAPSLFPKRPEECPPCNPFNCVLPAFGCLNNARCNDYNGQCVCPPGFGGEDCAKPLCGSLAAGQDHRFPREGDDCECDEGWSGLNCNVCETDEACEALIDRDHDRLIKGSDDTDDDKAVCYKEGFGVKEMYQICDVTNRKILDMLPGRPPQVTFTCDIPNESCGFQFWIGRKESFYCGLNNCTTSHSVGFESNTTEYRCETVECACIPGRMLCGEDGSVDISEFLTEEIKGPGKFTSKTGEPSRFEEPAMNQLINDIFGDTYITLNCKSGECMRSSEVPGFVRPPKPNDKTWVIVSVVLVVAVLLLGLFLFWYLGRGTTNVEYSFLGGRIRLPSNGHGDSGKSLLEDHIPTALQFSDISYTLSSGRRVLDGVSGAVQPGEVMAVLGASGAGKSTFLDILARKSKRGSVGGQVLVNGRKVSSTEYRRVVGFVDQEDTLMGTLTVYETVLYSALLRLPRDMSSEDKRMRTLETMHELGIIGIRDSRIGESGRRSISGGEKRRVSIACELVTSPSILFLDEPTSGLDSYNAYNVVESLVQLARNYKRTVIFTIHQPQSNIVALFDKLLLLASGKVVYSGKAEKAQQYFEGIGCSCPPGFNIADYLIDITMSEKSSSSTPASESLIQLDDSEDPERGNGRPRPAPVNTSHSSTTEETELDSRLNSPASLAGQAKKFFSSSSSGRNSPTSTPLPPHLARLVNAFTDSDVRKQTRAEVDGSQQQAANGNASSESHVLRNYKGATWWSQFKILSGRSFKNLYRDPMLMLSHYAVAVVAAGMCAFLFRGLTDDIPGFQNRMGMIFFTLALFGFGCLTTLAAFSSERLLFTRERANGYYNPFTYFAAKLLFDVIPLRVIPAFVFGAIVYNPVGLVPQVDSFWRFILVLVLFNLSASSVVLLLSILIKNAGVANLVGSLVMLFNLLFAGLLINRDKLPSWLRWLETWSFFHAAFEALLVNEVRYLQLRDHRYGVDIEVPAATILSMFGFKAQAFWFPDVSLLAVYFAGFTLLSYLALVLFVREKR
ncbi:putative ATP-dependent permease ADP1 [Sporobolomyces salmoneus]|uniref:putative ATP-dependent permease ADP1 n=1 Tax=Sporobolomyces salmoneus TaxID=183962 RepID=UPI00317F38AC